MFSIEKWFFSNLKSEECFITFLMHPWWHCSMRTDDGDSSEYNPLRAVHNPLVASTTMQIHQFNSLLLIILNFLFDKSLLKFPSFFNLSLFYTAIWFFFLDLKKKSSFFFVSDFSRLFSFFAILIPWIYRQEKTGFFLIFRSQNNSCE